LIPGANPEAGFRAASRAYIQKVMTKVDTRQRRMVEVLQAAVTG
jgi:hypothetical protein